jgi:hypothetical protein
LCQLKILHGFAKKFKTCVKLSRNAEKKLVSCAMQKKTAAMRSVKFVKKSGTYARQFNLAIKMPSKMRVKICARLVGTAMPPTVRFERNGAMCVKPIEKCVRNGAM